MAETRKVLKRCQKCGRSSLVRPRVRTCWLVSPATMPSFSKYACGGKLQALPARSKAKPEQRPQDLALKEMLKAQDKITEHLSAMRRHMTAIAKWQKREAYYGKRSAMSDADLIIEKQQREYRQRQRAAGKKTRAIAVED